MPRAEVSADLSRINVQTEFREKDLIRQVPGSRYDATAKTWHVPLTWAACKALRGVFGERLVVGEGLAHWGAEHVRNVVQPAMVLRSAIDFDGSDAWMMPQYLFPFQRAGVRFMQYTKRSLHGGQQRTGKMVQAVAFMQETRPFPALVISPNSVKRRWLNKGLAHFAPEIRAVSLEGTAVKRRKQIAAVIDGEYDVAIVNWEALRTLSRLAPYGSVALKRCAACGGEENVKPASCEAHERDLNLVDWRCVIADEAHRMKNPKAKQTRAAWWLARNAEYRFAMTGTPVADHPGDLWSLLHFVDPEAHPSKVKYVDRYCLVAQTEWGGVDVMGLHPQTEREFREIFEPVFIRHLRAAVLDQLPAEVETTVEVELPRAQRTIYNQLRDECIAELEGGTLIGVNALARATRLSQLACAAGQINQVTCNKCQNLDPSVDTDDLRLPCQRCHGTGVVDVVTLVEPSAKADAMEEILDDLEGERLVFCAESRQLLELCAARLDRRGVAYGRVMGGVDGDERERAEDNLRTGDVRCVLVTIGAGGEGLDFSGASTLVFLQRSWSALKNSQMHDRILGPMQTADTVQVIDVVAKDTIDEWRRTVLEEKGRRFEEVVQDEVALRALITGRDE